MGAKRFFGMFKQAVNDFIADEAMTLGAALAFYAMLSLAPLLILVFSVVGLAGEGFREDLTANIKAQVDPKAEGAVDLVVSNASQQQRTGIISTIISLGLLVLSATAVFAQLQTSLNKIWDVEARSGQGVWGWIHKRLLSLAMVAGIGVLALASVLVSSWIGRATMGGWAFWKVLDTAVSVGVFVAVFGLIYKFLPDVRIGWQEVWVGALITAVLFVLGKYALSQYFAYSSVGSVYGAAGSLVALLLWIYYSTLIFFFGAELTQVYADRYGRLIEPDEHGQWAPDAKWKQRNQEREEDPEDQI